MIGLLGFGTVGKGVAELLDHPNISCRLAAPGGTAAAAGARGLIKKILVRSAGARDLNGLPLDEEMLTCEIADILEDPEITVLLECTGADHAVDWFRDALTHGKDVITSNKKIVSRHFEELTRLAAENGRLFLYEASVGGGIPIIREIVQLKEQNHISAIEGILNGTCNFILSLLRQGKTYEQSLAEAQARGYAEADPTDDVAGYDTMRKLRILSSLAYDCKVAEQDIVCRGIEDLTIVDYRLLAERKREVKMLAYSAKQPDSHDVFACVFPTALRPKHPLAHIDGVDNCIIVSCDQTGTLGFRGPGAGSIPSASSMVADLLLAVKQRQVTADGAAADQDKHAADPAEPCGGQTEAARQRRRGIFYLRPARDQAQYFERLGARMINREVGAFLTKPLYFEDVCDLPGAAILYNWAAEESAD